MASLTRVSLGANDNGHPIHRHDASMAYTAHVIGHAIILCFSIGVLACGPAAHNAMAPKPTLRTGSGVFTVRYNPCQCLLHRSELSIEVKNGSHWERVALVNASSQVKQVQEILTQMRQRPGSLYTIKATLSDRLVKWNGNHASRTLIVSEHSLQSAASPVRPDPR